ncbi:uncharacterized protein LOC125260633 [Megalobrama amblycephala]|nr:uncharacterized protein LOC125260633 [Megalobrama amblycephala]
MEADESKDEEVVLSMQQEADIRKTASECDAKFNEVERIVQDNLWSRYGLHEVTDAISAAEKACDRVASMAVDGNDYENYEVQIDFLTKLVKEAIRALSNWERWTPDGERKVLEGRARRLKENSNDLEARKGEFARARRAAEDASGINPIVGTMPSATPFIAQATPIVKLRPASLPMFNGSKRDFYRWRKDWESLQQQGEPSGSVEVKKIQLLDSIDDRIVKDLRLSSYNTAEDVFRVLTNRYGNKYAITMEIVEELERLPVMRGNQPRRVIELIQTVEKALVDLTDLGDTGAIKNPLVVKSIESKLPEFMKRDWLALMSAPESNVTSENHFDKLLEFLKKEEGILERLEQLRVTEKVERQERKPERSHAFTKSTKTVPSESLCIVCGSEKHKGKIFFCRKFKELELAEKKVILRKLGVCRKCLGHHEDDSKCRDAFLCRRKDCRSGSSVEHHYLICPRGETKPEYKGRVTLREGKKGSQLTAEQEEFLSELSPEVAEKCKKAFTNSARMERSKSKKLGLLEENGLQELPVIMMLKEVTTNTGQKIGTLIDLASDTNYITHEAADRLRLSGEEINLVVHGVGKMAIHVRTKRYLLRIRVRTPVGTERAHQLVCYGLEEIARVHMSVSPERLKRFFPEVDLAELRRPEKIELLLSHREGKLAPQRVKIVGDLVLWDSPLGKMVGGAHPDLFEAVNMTAHESKTHFARSMRTAAVRYKEVLRESDPMHISRAPKGNKMACANVGSTLASGREFLQWWSWDSIGAACEPKCGGCRCGNCQPGGKEMTLAEEKELEIIRKGLTYVQADSHSDQPHWDARYPWIQEPSSLPYNRSGVESTFLRTEKQLGKVPEWKKVYTAQVHDMVERGAAVKLTKDALDKWKGPIWYVSHLVAPNPHSVTTPVRLVWNSSQKFKGLSMNDLLLKGPDVLNPIRAVLLRFRKGVFGALGDIKKMYNSVWLEEQEMHLHRFLWRDTPEGEIEEYAITRVNIGDRPAGCIAQLAMRETAGLAAFAHLREERRVLEEDSYVDDILTSHNDQRKLVEIVKGIEEILKAGGFSLKAWVWSGQSGRSGSERVNKAFPEKTIILPNQLGEGDDKALGVGYLAEEDRLYIMTSVNFSKRKKKLRTEQDLLEEEVRLKTPNPLTRRHLLSQVAGLYDPIGLITPAKQKGTILVRKAFQEAGGGGLTRHTWDTGLSEGIRGEAIELFEEYVRLQKVKFHRSLTPADWKGKPWGVTFSDGSDKTYGAVLYLRWNSSQGVVVRLVESKAKLTPLELKGDPIKAEICGAVFATRLRKYFEKHGRIEVEKWFHLVDSQTVLGAIQRDSYGYQTFFANRIGEIQKTGASSDWWWIPGDLNIADIITRGASPKDLDEDSIWQNGPEFLKRSVEEWPKRSAAEIADDARERVNKLQRKVFSAAVTRGQIKEVSVADESSRLEMLSKLVTEGLVDIEKFSSLSRLIRVIGWVWRSVRKWLESRNRGSMYGKQNPVGERVLTVKEREDVLKALFLAAQKSTTFPLTTLCRLAVFKEENNGLLVCGGRYEAFGKERNTVPILPMEARVSLLLAHEAHEANHEEIAGTLLRMRKVAWVVKGRRLAKRVVESCVICRKARAKRCKQIMSDLPPERIGPAAPFEFVTVDLFGPYEVKDEVKKRVRMKVWGIVYCCMASRAIHADVVGDQSTEGFLLSYKRFTALRGHPKKVWSDPGSNFVGAQSALKDLYEFLGRVEKPGLEEEAGRHGTEWSWKFHPANSPHRNGAAEAAVRVVKRSLHNLGGEGVFTWGEFQTFLCMAANLANERPIDARTQSREYCLEYITPNSLLLGRASPRGDPCDFDFEGYPYKRLRVIQGEINKFWKRWSQLAGPNLFIRSKWHTRERNVAVGDIVWVADQNALRSQYKLGRVIKVNADPKGIVRDVDVRVFSSHPVFCSGLEKTDTRKITKSESTKILSTVLHRDVRRLVVLIPVEEQFKNVEEKC